MTGAALAHPDLVRIAERWLRKHGRPIVLADVRTMVTSEQPDVIGWTNSGHSFVVECKCSRSDFLRDAGKHFRRNPAAGMGRERAYLAPAGLLRGSDMPAGWGLLEATERGRVVQVVEPAPFPEWAWRHELALLVNATRRATEGWGRKIFGEAGPELVDGDPHPSTAKVLRELRADNDRLRKLVATMSAGAAVR